ARERSRRIRLAAGDARAHAADVEEGPVDAERDEARFAFASEQRRGIDRLRAEQAAEREAREQVGGGDADARGGRMQPGLRGGDVRAAAQEVARRSRVDPG